jgi:hypothetical protein
MNRRAFVTGLRAALAPLGVEAQQAGRLYRIGILGNVSIAEPSVPLFGVPSSKA